jgi:hypothetical protein
MYILHGNSLPTHEDACRRGAGEGIEGCRTREIDVSPRYSHFESKNFYAVYEI